MKKQMEEEIRAQLMANQQMIADSADSWEQKVMFWHLENYLAYTFKYPSKCILSLDIFIYATHAVSFL